MTKTITTIETTPEELVSRLAQVVDKRIEKLQNQNQKPEKPVQVPEAASFVGKSQNWVRKQAGAGLFPAHRKAQYGDFYFFLSEIIAWIKEGRIVSNDELMQKANDYANSKTY